MMRYVNTALGRAVSASASAFSPLSIAGLQLWLKADAITGLVDSDPVTTWSDSSGNGNDATQATASRKPTYKTAIQNGKPVVRVDGVDDWMDVSSLSIAGGSYSVFCVFSSSDVVGKYLLDSSTGRFVFRPVGDIAGGIGWYDEGWKFVSDSFTPAFQILTWVLRAGELGEVFRNDVSLGTATYAQAGIGGVTRIMASSDALSTSHLTADIAEILLYNSALSTANRQSVENYLNSKWAIY